MTEQSKITVYTVGHSIQSVSDLLALLKRHCIQTVVDVRSAPYSRFVPQFNRETLEEALRTADVEYRYAGDYLGGRPAEADFYKRRQVPESKADYLHVVDYATYAKSARYLAGIQRIVELASGSATVLMCSEEDPLHCHRHHLIAPSLVERGLDVQHIRGDGRLQFAAVERQLDFLDEESHT